jgi:hypothetical protein
VAGTAQDIDQVAERHFELQRRIDGVLVPAQLAAHGLFVLQRDFAALQDIHRPRYARIALQEGP